jgi:hypothetical protein
MIRVERPFGRGPFRPSLHLAALVAVVMTATASAADFRAGDVIVVQGADTIEGDLYAVGDEVRILGRVTGDVIVAATRIVVSGEVGGDLIAAAQEIRIEGRIVDDARLAGGLVRLGRPAVDEASSGGAVVMSVAASVGGDLVASGGSVETWRGSTVDGDAAIAAGQVLMEASVAGGLRVASGAVRLDGPVGGRVDLELADGFGPWSWPGAPDDLARVSGGLRFGTAAAFAGDVQIAATGEPLVPRDRIEGAYTFEAVPVPAPRPWTVRFLERWGGIALAGLALMALRVGGTARAVEALRGRTLTAGMLGSVSWFVVPLLTVLAGAVVLAVAGIAAAVSLPGLAVSVGFVGGTAWSVAVVAAILLAAVVAPAVAAEALGTWLMRLGGVSTGGRPVALALGAAAIAALAVTPAVGSFTTPAFVTFGIGALALQAFARSRFATLASRRTAPAQAEDGRAD